MDLLETSPPRHLGGVGMEVHPQGWQVMIREMDLIRDQEVALVVEATDVAMLDMEGEILDMAEVMQVTEGATPAIHLTDQVLDAKTVHLRFDHTITVLVRLIQGPNASTQHHSIWLAWRRSFPGVNWHLLV